MNNLPLPPLPESDKSWAEMLPSEHIEYCEAYAREAQAIALEAAAKVCEYVGTATESTEWDRGHNKAAHGCAFAIRALQVKP